MYAIFAENVCYLLGKSIRFSGGIFLSLWVHQIGHHSIKIVFFLIVLHISDKLPKFV